MKKIIIMLLLACCCACTKTEGEIINSNDTLLSESMKNFFADDVTSYVQGEHFQAKIISIAKVQYDDSYLYQYQITVAPLRDEKVDIKSFEMSLNDEMKGYFDFEDIYLGFSFPMFEDFDIPVKEGKESIVAYRFDKTLNNLNNQTQKEAGFSDAYFDKAVTTIYITIKSNYGEETIIVPFTDELLVIDEESDLPENREDLRQLFQSGSLEERTVAGVYEKEVWE